MSKMYIIDTKVSEQTTTEDLYLVMALKQDGSKYDFSICHFIQRFFPPFSYTCVIAKGGKQESSMIGVTIKFC